MFCRKIISKCCSRSSNLTFLTQHWNSIFSLNTFPRHFSILASSSNENRELLINQTKVIIFERNYAKGKDKKKDKGKSKVVINENEIGEVTNVENLKKNMTVALNQLENDFIKHLSLRSTTGAIESVIVELDGKEHTLQELAQIIRKNPKIVVLNFLNFPQAIPAALKAIEKSGMNLSPQQDGTTLFIPVPKVTKEHRESLSKNAKQLFVKCRTTVKDVQQKHIKQIKRNTKISEDFARNVEQQIIALADQYVAEAETLLQKKQNELLGEK